MLSLLSTQNQAHDFETREISNYVNGSENEKY